jgi:hypothetical protein
MATPTHLKVNGTANSACGNGIAPVWSATNGDR